MRRLIFTCHQSPGDVLMSTAAVRDLNLAHPGQFQTDVRTSADELFLHNPYISKLSESDPSVEKIELHYHSIHQSNQRPLHFIHGFPLFLEARLGVRIPVTQFRGDIHLAEHEKELPAHLAALGVEGPFWILIAGGKYDFTAKWVNPAVWTAVVKHFEGRILFVQCGEANHWHPRIPGALDAVGKTSTREFVRLMYHAQGVCSPVTFAMHLAAAVPLKPGRQLRPAVVVAGGREPAHWEQYPGHAFLDTVGRLPCCAAGGCWKSRCQIVGDGDAKDRHDVCERPVQITPELRVAQCMTMITPGDVIRAIEGYYDGGMLRYREVTGDRLQGTDGGRMKDEGGRMKDEGGRMMKADGTHEMRGAMPEPRSGNTVVPTQSVGTRKMTKDREPMPPASHLQSAIPGTLSAVPQSPIPVLIIFTHGLGDAVQLTNVLLHLRHYHPEWAIDLAAGVGKHSAFAGLCRRVFIREREQPDRSAYRHVFELSWDECPTCYGNSPSTKAEYCLRSVFRLEPLPELCRYQIAVGDAAAGAARRYLREICAAGPRRDGRFPAVLIHYEGNTSSDKKNLPHDMVGRLCETVIKMGFVPVILDWDRRSPLADGARIFNPGAEHELWGRTGTGDAEALAALTAQSVLMIGIDSGPMHVSVAGDTPAIAVWTGHHPLHYVPPAEHVLHLVPVNHASLLRGGNPAALTYFSQRYRYQEYANLESSLVAAVAARLDDDPDGLVHTRRFWVRRDNVEQDLVIVNDIAENDSYGIGQMPLAGPVAVDVGAHVGVFSAAFRRRFLHARVVAVECCPENIPALQRNVGGFASIVQAAMTYDRDVALLNSVYPDCVSTGGSTVVPRGELEERLAAVANPGHGLDGAAMHRAERLRENPEPRTPSSLLGGTPAGTSALKQACDFARRAAVECA